jgi:hypothetical protein
MKIKTIIAALLIMPMALLAQEESSLKNKNGKEILPQVGDISFGINAEPFLNYAGNLFDQTGTNSLSLTLPQNTAVFGFKYVAKSDLHYRAGVRLNFSHDVNNEFVTDFNDFDEQVEDKMVTDYSNIYISGGIEKRRGKGRLVGFYGAEAALSFSTLKYKYEYGNSLSDVTTNLVGFTHDFGTNIEYSTPMRMTEDKAGMEIGVGASLLFGAEYFFLPKVSVTGTFSWNFMFTMEGEGEENYEYYDFFGGGEETETAKSAGDSNLGFDNMPVGILSINLYF